MLSTSFEYRYRTARNTKTLFKATLTLADGTVHEIGGEDVSMGSESFSESVSSNGSFDIGAAITNQFSVELKNYDGRWDDCVFTGATIAPYVGVQLSDGVEWLLKGRYGVEQPERYGSTIGLTCLDDMRLLDRPYSDVATAYPASAQTIVRDICTVCGVTPPAAFANGGYVVSGRPDDGGSLTCGAVISYVAQVTGNYARCDANGRLVLSWYNTGAFEDEGWLDGQCFDEGSPYASGDDADGGDFTDYGSGAECDGGSFGFGAYAQLYAITGLSVATDDVVVTGVRVTAQDADGGIGADDGESALYGSEGYVLAVSGNPLVLPGQAAAVAAQVGARVVGMRFRPFNVSAIGNPAYEAGDPVIITDRKLAQYRSFITTLTYKVGHYETFACNAEAPARRSAQTFSSMTEAIVQARKAIKRERTAREQAIATLADELGASSGLYETEAEQEDHSVIHYLHDKPTLAESQIVWKLAAQAFGISTDGGRTYPFGFDAWGQAILNSIYAIGIDADYIVAGERLVVGREAAGQYNVVLTSSAMTIRRYTDPLFSVDTYVATINDVEREYAVMTMGDDFKLWARSGDATRLYNPNGVAIVGYRGYGAYSEWNGSSQIGLSTVWMLDALTGDAPLLWIGPRALLSDTSGKWYVGLRAGTDAYLLFTKTSHFDHTANADLHAAILGLYGSTSVNVQGASGLYLKGGATGNQAEVNLATAKITLKPGSSGTVDMGGAGMVVVPSADSSIRLGSTNNFGYSGTVTNPSSITVMNGLITRIS